MILSPHEIAYLFLWAGWTQETEKDKKDLTDGVAGCLAESGGDTNIMGRSPSGVNIGQRDHGLMQISGRWHGAKLQEAAARGESWRNPYVNIRMARVIWVAAGGLWAPTWHVFIPPKDAAGNITGPASYEKYLPDARVAVQWPFKPIY
jgi:hypothetical protein